MKKIAAARWLSFLLMPVSITALPQGEHVVHGEAEFHLDGNSYCITATDKSIISYDSFNVGRQEQLRFIQPSKESTLLNRVVGSSSSQIFGNISSNGKVFLVNPHGVYFGKEATVDTGSLIVSTLDILDQDFLENRFSFRSKEGLLPSFIHNEGTLISSNGIVCLISPQIKNEGAIRANLSKVLLAGTEAVTLTFSEDGLLSFEIDSSLKEGLIEHLGTIEANEIFIHLAQAKEAIENVINVDGLIDGNTLIQENGKVRIAHQSSLKADQIFIEGSNVSVEGEIDVSRAASGKAGGTLHILGDHIKLVGAQIDASGDLDGGIVLIGGEYKGQGDIRKALTNTMDENSTIKANSLINGNGGRVILWADDTTLFNGKIFAQGGSLSGNGGFVETSGKGNLGVTTGYVNTLAPFGRAGDWLLDPTTITVIGGGGASLAQAADCTNTTTGVSISGATINAAVANVILCASTSITLSANLNLANTGIGITFQGTGGTITTSLGGNVTTRGGVIAFASTTVSLNAATVTLDTTGPSGVVPAGNNISFDSVATINGANTLTLKGGTTGTVSFGAAIGGAVAVANLDVQNAALIQLGANITLSGANNITFPSPIDLTGSSTITSNNKNITFNDIINGNNSLTLTAGSGTILLSNNIGGTTALSNLAFTGTTGAITLNGNIAADNSTLTFPSAVILLHAAGIDVSSSNGNISFSSTVNGAFDLILAAGTGTVTFSGAIGGTTALTNVIFTSANLVQIGDNITIDGTAVLPLQFPTVSLTNNSSITSTTSNGNIIFTDIINAASAGSQNLTLTASSGTVTFSGIVGGTTRLGALNIASTAGSSSVSINNNITANSFTITNAVPTVLAGSCSIDTSANNGAISFGGTINATTPGIQNLTLNTGSSGAITLSGVVGGTTRLGALLISSTAGSSTLAIGANITANSFIITNNVPTTLTGSSSINTSANNGPISFGGTINATSAGTQTLTLNAGSLGAITLSGAVGGTTRLGAILISSTAGSSTVSIGANITANSFTITNAVPTTLTGSSSIDTSTNNGAISFGGTINATSAGSQNLTLNAGTNGSITFTGSIGATTRLGALLISSASAGTGSVSIGANITANSFTITNNVPTTLAGSSSINTSTNNGAISFGGTINAASAGTQTLTLNAGSSGAITFNGAVGGTTRLGALLISSTAGSSTVSVGANITANSFTITNNVPTTLTGSSSIDTSASNGAISFGGTIDATSAGSQSLTLNAGTNGAITLTHTIGGGIRLGALLISSASAGSGSVSIGGNTTANSFTITNSVPLVLTASVSIDTSAVGGAISLGGIVNASIAGSQNLTLNAGSSGAITLTGAVGGATRLGVLLVSSSAGSSVSIGANITANSFTITNSVPAVLAASIAIDTSANNGAISFGGSINGTSAGSQNLTLNAGSSGAITFFGAVGAGTRLGALLISSSAGSTVSIGANITANSFTITNSVPAVLTATTAINTSANNGQISFGGTLNGAVALTLTAGTGNIDFVGAVGGAIALTSLIASGTAITQGAALSATGAVDYTNTGLLTIGGTLDLGSLVQGGGGTVLLEADINAMTSIHAADPINFNTTVSLTAAGIGGMLFDSAVIPTIDSAYDLTFTVTGGGIAAPQLGSPSNYINTLTITAQNIVVPPLLIYANNYNPHTSNIINSNIISPGGHLLFSTPTTVFIGHFTIDVTGGVSAGSVTFADTLGGPGGLTFDVGDGNLVFAGAVGATTPLADVIISSANDVTIGDGFTASSLVQTAGTGTTTISGTITTSTSTGVSLNAPIELASAVNMNTTTGNGAITFGTSSSIDGAEILSFSAGSGSVFLGGAIGGTTPLIDLIFTSAGLIEIKSDITVTGANPLIFSGPVKIAGISIITSNNADITFENSLDGSIDPTIDAGTGTVTFSEPMGNIIPLSDLTVIAGIINQDSSLTSSGAVTYINSGLATILGQISADSFTQSGGGSVLLGADISANSFIQLTNPVSFTGAFSLSAGGSGGILFDSPIIPTTNRLYNLTLSARNGSIIGPQLGSPTAYINRLVMRAKFINVPLIYANTIVEIITTPLNPYFEYIPGIYTNYWKEKDTLSSPWYFDPGFITDQRVTPWKGSIWAL